MLNHIAQIEQTLGPQRESLLNHPIYDSISDLRHIQIFMEHHVFAVWDFMSLLKALQRCFGSFSVPWVDSGNAEAVRLLLEIAIDEECDVDAQGDYKSHFELYRAAMVEAGASTTAIDCFIKSISDSNDIDDGLIRANVPVSVRLFIQSTFAVIDRNDPVELAATFLFGREELLPDIFRQIVGNISNADSGMLSQFVYYLERHIEVDGDQHYDAAKKLMESICGNDSEKWASAENAAIQALSNRGDLWNGIRASLGKASGQLDRTF